jgi:predicted enzyme related to lactoylglutathione lyase
VAALVGAGTIEGRARLGRQASRSWWIGILQFVNHASAVPGAPQVCFQRVPEPKMVKNRLHFDLQVEDVEKACARIEALRGRRRDDHDFHEHGFSWRRMADPEGNEFCLIYDV